jgi:thiol-disulfide isomerase/thioredoxin
MLVENVTRGPWELPERAATVDRLATEYRRASQQYPRNPAYPYLLGILEENPDTARTFFQHALLLDPNFATAHEAVARSLYRKDTPNEKKEARKHLDAFAQLCPAKTKNLLALVSLSNDRAAWGTYAPTLRHAITPESGQFEELADLWDCEFAYADPASFSALRSDVSRQIEALRKLDRVSDPRWLAALEEGYKLTNDDAGKRWAEDDRLTRFPCTWEASSVRFERYQKEHGKAPEGGAALKDWNKETLLAVEGWLRQCPDESRLLQERLGLLGEEDSPDPKQVELAGDKALAVVGPIVSADVARLYIDKRVRLDRVDALLSSDQRRIDAEWKNTQASGLEAEDLATMRGYHLAQTCGNEELRVRLALALKDQARAERELLRLDKTISEIEKSSAKPDARKSLTFRQAKAWKLRAEKEILAGHLEPALSDYGRSIELNPDDRKVIEAARTVYTQVHGSAQGFDAWSQTFEAHARTASEEVARAVMRPLPHIDLPDLSGKKWTSSDLQGKALLVTIWATWCGPCQGELPHVQKLYESWKGNRSFGVVTLSVDHNPGLIEPYMKERKYTFPVLIAGAESFRSWAPHGIPMNYVVNPSGMIVQEQSGFGRGGDLWEKKMEGYLAAALTESEKSASKTPR